MPSFAAPANPRFREKGTTRTSGDSRARRSRSAGAEALSTTTIERSIPVCASRDRSAAKRESPPSRLTTTQSTSGSWKGGLKRLTRTRARCKPAALMLPRERLREEAETLLREFPERYGTSGIERFVELDRARRESVTRLEEKRRRRNELTAVRGRPDPEALAEMKGLKEEIKALEEETQAREEELSETERRIPNVPHASVPRGPDEKANRVERTWGEPRRFDVPPLPHWDLGPAL